MTHSATVSIRTGPHLRRQPRGPSRFDRDVIVLEGHQLRVIEVGQGDIAPSAVLH